MKEEVLISMPPTKLPRNCSLIQEKSSLAQNHK